MSTSTAWKGIDAREKHPYIYSLKVLYDMKIYADLREL